MEGIPFPSETAVQPDWIREKYPNYAEDHGMHPELSSVRKVTHRGHTIKITTTYVIEIDGRRHSLHMVVGDDGGLFCHSTPYHRYRSAVDLVETLIDRFPAAFEADASRADPGKKDSGTLTAEDV